MVKRQWHEEKSFWETFEPTLFGEKVMSRTNEEVDKITTLLGFNGDRGRIVDLCCGVGRHSLELARRGFSVTGVDITAKYLDGARKKAEDEGLDAQFVQEDVRSFVREGAFDAALNMYTSFGYFEQPDDDKKVIENVYASLKEGGRFAIDLVGKDQLVTAFQPRDWHEEDGTLLLSERRIEDNWTKIVTKWILIKDGTRTEKEFALRLYSEYELKELLKKCGFKKINTYSNLDGEKYHQHAKRLIAVAKK
ncbi:MAG: class I SAM-dependent methyltransferase [Anaerohalosphaera sp.]|nr:class I SAM-dependent methyltransferase [Anaerohalosphaera sp.]